MRTFIFFGTNEDTYWRILCAGKYFRGRGKSKAERMMMAAMAKRAHALKWYIWWSHPHLESSWDTFTWRQILPIFDKEIEEVGELLKSAKEIFTPDNFVIDSLSAIVGDQKVLEPPPILMQKQAHSPSCESYQHRAKNTDYISLTPPMFKPHFNGKGFHNDVDFVIPPLKPPDKFFKKQ
jgi:hypothetical protein